LIHQG